MSQFESISGVSLEKYAKLCALMSKTEPHEVDKHAAIAVENGITKDDWEAAKDGWTKKMTDPNLAMAIQQVFMPIYQSTLEEMSGGEAPIELEKYAEIKAAMIFEVDANGNKPDPNLVLARYGYTITSWSSCESFWTSRVTKDEHGRVIDNFSEEAHLKFNELMNKYAKQYAEQAY